MQNPQSNHNFCVYFKTFMFLQCFVLSLAFDFVCGTINKLVHFQYRMNKGER